MGDYGQRRGSRAVVEWQQIDAELQEVPEEYREQRFYPLKHVVEIFSSDNPEAHWQEERLSDLVDDVVEVYHEGFAKSIQNYSRILQLFQETKQQVDSLKQHATDATKQLGAQSKTLHSQWRRSLSLQASLSLLDEVKQVVEVPAKVEAAVKAKDWTTAVSELLEGCQMLVGENLSRVGALRKLRGDLTRMSSWIKDLLYEELQLRVYRQEQDDPETHLQRAGHGQAGRSGAAAGTATIAFRSTGTAAVAAASSAAAAAAAGPGGMRGTASVLLPRAGAGGSFLAPGPARGGKAATASFLAPRSGPGSGAGQGSAATPQRGAAGGSATGLALVGAGAGAGAVQVSTREVVRCLAHLDGVAEAKAYLRYHTRAQIRRLFRRGLEAAAESAQATYHSMLAGGTADAGGGLSLALPHAVEVLAQRLVQEVSASSLKALMALGSVLQELAGAPAGAGHMHTLALLQQLDDHSLGGAGAGMGGISAAASPPSQQGLGGWGRRTKDREGASPMAAERLEYVRTEYLYAWAQMQEEWMLLLSELLLLPARSMGQLADAASQQHQQHPQHLGLGLLMAPVAGLQAVNGWFAGMADMAEQALGGKSEQQELKEQQAKAAASKSQEGSKLTFAFDVTLQGQAGTEQASSAMDAKATETAGYVAILYRALGNHHGSPYLTPAVYTAIKSFAEAAATVLTPAFRPPAVLDSEPNTPSPLTKQGRSLAATSGGSAATGGGDGGGGRSAAEQQVLRWLLQQLEGFVQDTFLPRTWVDLRGRCAAALEHPDAFRPPQLGLAAAAAVAAARISAAVAGQGARLGSGLGGGRGGGGGLAPAASIGVGLGAGGEGGAASGVVAAARFVGRTLRDIRGWSDAMLGFEDAFAGLLEAVLSRALNAFTAAAEQAAGSSVAWQLAGRPDVSHAMALSPDAPLLGGPLSFYTAASAAPGVWDMDSFAASLRTLERPMLVPSQHRRNTRSAGFGGGGGHAEAEVLQLVFRQQPVASEHLLAGAGPSSTATRLQQLAAIAEGAEHVADATLRQLGRRRQEPGHEGLPHGLGQLVHKYRMLSGCCCRALRLELQLQVAHLLHPLSRASHLCDGEDAKEVHPSIGSLLRVMARLCEELEPHLKAHRAAYVVAGVAPAAARCAMWILPGLQEINKLGVQRMLRTLSSLQPSLSGLSALLAAAAAAITSNPQDADDGDGDDEPHPPATSSGGASQQEGGGAGGEAAPPTTNPRGTAGLEGQLEEWARRVSKLYHHADRYYHMLLLPMEEVLREAEASPLLFSYAEWVALLEARVSRRLVTVGDLEQLQGALDAAYGIAPKNMMAEALGNVVSAIQTPAEVITDTLTDVLRVGGGALVAGAMLPAQGIRMVFEKIQVLNKAGGFGGGAAGTQPSPGPN